MKRACLVAVLASSCTKTAREQARLQKELQERIRAKIAEAEGRAPATPSEKGEPEEPEKPPPPPPTRPRLTRDQLLAQLSRTGTVEVRTADERGRELTARVRLVHSSLGPVGRERGLEGFICPGRARKKAPLGTINVAVTAGHRRIPFWTSVGVLERRLARVNARLPLRPDLDVERAGWYGVAFSCPGAADGASRYAQAANRLSSSRAAPAAGSNGAARRARAEGVALLLDPASSDGAARAGNCVYGELLLVGARAREAGLFSRGLETPNFVVLREARRRGAASVLLHPTLEVRLDPSEAAATRPFLRGYCAPGSVELVGLAAEVPFDSFIGVMPDALDLSSPGAEELWFLLLNRGHKLCAVLVRESGHAFPSTYAQTVARPGPQRVARAIRAGRTMPTEGPLVFMLMDGAGAGRTLRADGSARALVVAAHADCWSEGLKKIEVIRNGRVLFSTSCHMDKCHVFSRRVRETEKAWYVVRTTAVSNRWHPLGAGKEIRAWAGPVYFSPRPRAGFPPMTRVEGKVQGASAARVRASRGRAVFDEAEVKEGRFRLRCPPDSTLELTSTGATRKHLLFEFLPARELVRMIHTDHWGLGARALLDNRTYGRMREACSQAVVSFELSPESGGGSR